ncbi:hypothetical protein HN51_060036, partial [Arachis hypogaea]
MRLSSFSLCWSGRPLIPVVVVVVSLFVPVVVIGVMLLLQFPSSLPAVHQPS